MKIAYLSRNFPVSSECFLPREIQSLHECGAAISIYALGGSLVNEWKNQSVHTLSIIEWASIVFWKLYWIIKRPMQSIAIFRELYFATGSPNSIANFFETLWGVWAGMVIAHKLKGRVDVIYANEGGMSSTAAWVVSIFTDTPFAFGVQAHDVIPSGGDWLLEVKCRAAAFVRTFSDGTKKRLIDKFSWIRDRVEVIRPGLLAIPEQVPVRLKHDVMRCLSVGPLTERKGYFDLLNIYAALREAEHPFEAHIIGKGPLKAKLEQRIESLGLRGHVRIIPMASPNQLLEQYLWADLFFYTGKPTELGDIDDAPSAILEAMATSLPVLTTPVESVLEVVTAGYTGMVGPFGDTGTWLQIIQTLKSDSELTALLVKHSREWAETHFDARESARQLLAAIAKGATG